MNRGSGRPGLIGFVVLLNIVGAGSIGYVLGSGATGYLASDFPPRGPLYLGVALWVIGATGLWCRKRWGWYLALGAATVAALFASLVALMLIFFHGAPSVSDFANVEALRIVVVALLPWGFVISLLHPHVRTWVKR